MRYTIEWCEQKPTKEGKQRMIARLKGEDKILHENVAIWGNFPGFAELGNGGSVEGDIVPATDPKYGPSLYPPKVAKTASTGAFKQKVIEETMAKKEASIGRFQASKESSIAQMSAERDAVLIVTTFYKDRWANDPILESELDSLIKRKVIEFRDWFLSHEFQETLPF